jgi:AcrR family transcriptional regulator
VPRDPGPTARGRERPAQQRLPAAERREALLDAARRVFTEGSYSGATTAEIARAAGVSEPILYRHFASKLELYLAVMNDSWERLRAAWSDALAAASPEDVTAVLFGVVRALKRQGVVPSILWIQALTEAGEDPAIRRYMRRHLRDVHDYVAAAIVAAQAGGAVAADRDAEAEAWIFIAGGLLYSASARLGGLLSDDDLLRVSAARRRWLTGA